MKKAKYIISKIPWLWVAGGGVLGYIMIHPLVMIVAYFMFHSSPEDNTTLFELIKLELIRLFSADMLPWSVNFALISATAAGFLGRIRQVNAALRESEKVEAVLKSMQTMTGILAEHIATHNAEIMRWIEFRKRQGHQVSKKVENPNKKIADVLQSLSEISFVWPYTENRPKDIGDIEKIMQSKLDQITSISKTAIDR